MPESIELEWRSTCKILFGREVGALSKYVKWLAEQNEPIAVKKSSISGKMVSYFLPQYCEGAKFASYDELSLLPKFAPLSINDIKDIDSLFASVRERAYYTGNIILGNSGQVEGSTGVINSFCIYNSANVSDSKYIAHTTLSKLCDHAFGCNGIGESKYVVRCYETYRDTRCFEEYKSNVCSDCYYFHGLSKCTNCMFSFNLRSKSHCIGNLELPKEKYLSLKSSLLSEMAGMLERDARLPSLLELVSQSSEKADSSILAKASVDEKEEKTDMASVNREFSSAMQVITGKKLGTLEEYAPYLVRGIRGISPAKSAVSGKKMNVCHYCNMDLYPKDRLAKQNEAEKLGQILKFAESDLSSPSFKSIASLIGKIAYFSTEYTEGQCSNLIDCPTAESSSNSYLTSPIVMAKNCGCTFWPRSSESIFGSDSTINSSFCLKCFFSQQLTRCMEVDNSTNCSDCYFSHNIENCQDCILCFNVKGMRNAVGNTELPRGEYLKIKKMLLDGIFADFEKKKATDLSIFSAGCKIRASNSGTL